jgi:hypothetical protein
MRDRSFWSVSALAAAASVVLASCGGDILAAVAFIGSAGGDWVVDGNSTQAGLQARETCANDGNGRGVPGTERCRINITAVNATDLYARAFDVTYSGNLPNCPLDAVNGGRVDGKRINLPNCFAGEYISVNEVRSDAGDRLLFETFLPDLTEGVWVEIQQGERRFKFTSNSAGCELTATAKLAVALTVTRATFDLDPPPDPFETRISGFRIAGGAAYGGRFLGVSGLQLQRGTEVLELERRVDGATPTTCT